MGGNARELFLYDVDILCVGNYPEVLNGADSLETVNGELNQGSSAAKDVDELLGVFWGAQWPEAAAYAASHDYNMRVSH